MKIEKKNAVISLMGNVLLECACIFLLSGSSLAKTEIDVGPEFSGGQWIWSLFSLIVIAVLAYWATRFLAGRVGFSQARNMKVAESLFLGPNRHLCLLLVNEKVLLLGCTEHGISLLKEFEDRQFYEELLKTAESSQNLPMGRFARMIAPALNRMNSIETYEASLSNMRQRLQEGLEKIRSWKRQGHDHDDKV